MLDAIAAHVELVQGDHIFGEVVPNAAEHSLSEHHPKQRKYREGVEYLERRCAED